ncbi:MAG TPA: glycosyltransferase family 87 protein [Gaiellaceae bacterium]|nr:glycosyltransferase family 87 protein [Gaiellaceae bacterium]
MTRARWVALAAASAALFLGSWTLLHQLWYRSASQIVDTPGYETYGDAIVAGHVPYRDFSVEYPPGALLPMLAPELTASRGKFGEYGHSFEKWMAGAGVLMTLLVALALAALRPPPLRAVVAMLLVGASPLLLGNLMLSRFDLWVAALTVGALAALLWERDTTSAIVLGAAIATKLFPAVLVPVGLAWVWRRRGRRAAFVWTALVAAVCAAVFVPFAVLSPGGVRHSFGVQLNRPLQLESLGGAILIALHNDAGTTLHVFTTVSQNLSGPGAHAAAVLSSVVQVAALLAVWLHYARGSATRERLVTHVAAAVVAFIAFDKVLSPQYLIWLIPLVPLVRSRLAQVLLVAALVLTQIEFPARYWALANDLRPSIAAVVLTRDLVLVVLAVLLVVEPGHEHVEEPALLVGGQSP